MLFIRSHAPYNRVHSSIYASVKTWVVVLLCLHAEIEGSQLARTRAVIPPGRAWAAVPQSHGITQAYGCNTASLAANCSKSWRTQQKQVVAVASAVG